LSHHDALYYESSPEELVEVAYLVKKHMEKATPEMFNMSFSVDMYVGRRWGEYDDELTKSVLDEVEERMRSD